MTTDIHHAIQRSTPSFLAQNAALCLDIGGANIKSFDGTDPQSVRFDLWKQPDKLAPFLSQRFSSVRGGVAVTMTGELCDCFESRQSGVRSIVASVVEAFPDNPICFYQVDGGFVDREGAVKNWQKTAAANWHAIASMIGRRAPQLDGLFIDMGSTTTDLIPIVKGQVHSQGSNDFERLVHQELIYTGLGRTPVNTLVTEIMIGDARTRIAAECFATMLDAHVIAGTIPANDQNLNTCDGRSLTRDNSLRRLARMLCTEPDVVGIDRLEKWAEEIIGKQMEIISKAASKQLGLLSKDAVVWISGEGSQVLAELLKPFAERQSVLPVWEDSPSSNAAAAVALWHLLETDFER